MNLVLVTTGLLPAAYVPSMLAWVHQNRPDVSVQVVRTRVARAYVTRPALQRLSGRTVLDDEWDIDAAGLGVHRDLSDWADAVLIYPADQDYVERIADGDRDTPSRLLIAQTAVPVLLAADPGGGGRTGKKFRQALIRAENRCGATLLIMRSIGGESQCLWAPGIRECFDALDAIVAGQLAQVLSAHVSDLVPDNLA